MNNLQLDERTAKKLYSETPNWFQSILKTTFGEDVAKKRVYTDIKSYDDAVEELPVDSENVIQSTDSIDIVAYKKIKHILKAINNGWIPDWSNKNQYKYYPYFEVLPSGFGFSGTDYAYPRTSTSVGSRLCTDTSEKAKYMATQFQDLYEQFLLIKN